MFLFNDFLALERVEEKAQGVLIPMEMKDGKPKLGKIIFFDENVSALPNGRFLVEGDVVVFLEYAPHIITIDGKEILFVKFEDIIAKL